jgi:glycosyltransferase involved in cell wall biosynthesis
MPEVSVIVPNYNHAGFLQQRIDSILQQTFQDFELIILDDCSTDNSQAIIELYKSNSRISHIEYNKINGGSTFKQWQLGVTMAKGNLIWLAESDDWADERFLEKLVPVLKKTPTITLAYCQSYDADAQGKELASRIYWTSNFEENIWNDSFSVNGETFIQYLFEQNVIPNASACLIRKECLAEVLEGEKSIAGLKMCGDWFTWLLMASNPGSQFAFLNEHLNYFRITYQSTRNHQSTSRMTQRILEEAYIFNAGKFSIGKEAHFKKNSRLKSSWFNLFSTVGFSLSFFSLAPLIGMGKIKLLKEYILFKKAS